jgi:hypothetical protein
MAASEDTGRESGHLTPASCRSWNSIRAAPGSGRSTCNCYDSRSRQANAALGLKLTLPLPPQISGSPSEAFV